MGKILRVDLTTRRTSTSALSTDLIENYVGGRGIGARLLYDEVRAGVDPLGEENKLILAGGPLAGTLAPSAIRSWLTAKSPQTGTILSTSAGGTVAAELQRAGYGALIIEGTAEESTCIMIRDQQVDFHSAGPLWGRGTNETERRLKENFDPKAEVISIGPAGERLVKIAAVITQKRAFGRGGPGAVMGAKKLKAVAVRGTGEPEVADPEGLKSIVGQWYASNPKTYLWEWRKYGTPILVDSMNEMGVFPTRNFQSGYFPDHKLINSEAHQKLTAKHVGCYRCPIACTSLAEVKEGPYAGFATEGPEYETMWAFGAQCGNSSLEAIISADEVCDDLGLDTMSAGYAIGFAMELFQRGVISEEDTGGLKLEFGDHQAMGTLLKKIAYRDGFGDVLAEGSRIAASRIGNGADRYVMHVKGLELAGYDPRGCKAMGVGYATSTRGACHNKGYPFQEFMGQVDRLAFRGKGKLTKENQDFMALLDSTGICAFTLYGTINLEWMGRALAAVTGIQKFSDSAHSLTAGERVFNVEAAFNAREGFSRKDDTLPERLLKEPMPEGGSSGQIVELEPMLDEYYEAREWTGDGKPSRQKLLQLNLIREANELWPQ